jgi:hypothetical protein
MLYVGFCKWHRIAETPASAIIAPPWQAGIFHFCAAKLLKCHLAVLIRLSSYPRKEPQEGPMRGFEFELDQLLNPATVFDHPRDVLNDPDLTKHEKRAILSFWASDACAVQCLPGMRMPPDAKKPVSFDEIIDALKSLDDDSSRPRPGGFAKRLKSKWRNRGNEEGSTPLAA